MTKRITTYTGKAYQCTVRLDRELEEYVAKLYRIADNHLIGEYFTEDINDALQTAEAMFNKAENAKHIS